MNLVGIIFSVIGGICMVLLIALPIGMIGLNIYGSAEEKRYMEEQSQTGRDKQRMLDFMQIVMKEYYHDYTCRKLLDSGGTLQEVLLPVYRMF